MSADSYEDIYAWVDTIPLSRRKKNISRDFSDAVLLAEILKYFFPKLVDLHNYSPVNSKISKIKNWEILNNKVLKKLSISISKKDILELSSATPGAVEYLLSIIQKRVDSNFKESMGDLSVADTLDIDYGIEAAPTQEDISNLNKKLDEYRQELMEKEEIISNLRGDIGHLNELIKLKDRRIMDLTVQIKRAHSNVNMDYFSDLKPI